MDDEEYGGETTNDSQPVIEEQPPVVEIIDIQIQPQEPEIEITMEPMNDDVLKYNSIAHCSRTLEILISIL